MSLAALSDWLSRSGAEVRGAAVVEGASAGRCFKATEDIHAGDEVVRVPRAAFITLDMARRSPVGRQVLGAGIEPPGGHCYLAAYLLGEKRRRSSAIAPYIDALPAAFPGVPLFWQKRLMPVLGGSLIGKLIAQRTDLLRRDFAAVRRGVPALGGVSMAEFVWARTAVITRVFGLRIGGAATEALVPLADMMNHGRPPDVDWTYDDGQGAFLMKAARDIRCGDEIRDSYGRKPNGRFFLHYGFALATGADDEAEVDLSLLKDDPRRSAKAAALERRTGQEGPYRISNRLRGDDTQRAFTFLRTACATGREIDKALRLLAEDKCVGPLSPRNEAAALALLHRVCAEALDRYDSPLPDEEAALGRPDLAEPLRNALLVLRGEKRLLRAYRSLAEQSIPLLRLPRAQFFTAAAQYTGAPLTMSYLLDTALALAPRAAKPPSFRSIGL